MKRISPALKAHLAQDVTTLATCWRVLLKNGTYLGFTDHTRDLRMTEYRGGGLSSGGTTNFPTAFTLIYKSASGYIPSAVDTSSMLDVDNLEIEAILNGDDVKEGDLLAGLWDFAEVEQFIVNYEDLTMGRLIQRTGTIGQITIRDASFVAEVRGLTQFYQNEIGELYSPVCRARLGDARCKVSKASYTTSGTIATVDNSTGKFTSGQLTQASEIEGVGITGISRAKRAIVTTASVHGFNNGENVYIDGVAGVVRMGVEGEDEQGLPYTGSGADINGQIYVISDVTPNSFSIPVDTRLAVKDGDSWNTDAGPPPEQQYTAYEGGGEAVKDGTSGFYAYGTVTFKSGLNQGLSMEVKFYTTGEITLQLPMPYDIAVGDSFEVVAGCAGRLVEDCKNKFNNVINFRGEPYLPGLDQAITSGSPPEFQRATDALDPNADSGVSGFDSGGTFTSGPDGIPG